MLYYSIYICYSKGLNSTNNGRLAYINELYFPQQSVSFVNLVLRFGLTNEIKLKGDVFLI